MRGCAMRMTEIPFLKAMARGSPGVRRRRLLDERARRLRAQRVQDAHRDAALDGGPDGGRVQHLGPEVGELGRLVEA